MKYSENYFNNLVSLTLPISAIYKQRTLFSNQFSSLDNSPTLLFLIFLMNYKEDSRNKIFSSIKTCQNQLVQFEMLLSNASRRVNILSFLPNSVKEQVKSSLSQYSNIHHHGNTFKSLFESKTYHNILKVFDFKVLDHFPKLNKYQSFREELKNKLSTAKISLSNFIDTYLNLYSAYKKSFTSMPNKINIHIFDEYFRNQLDS